MFYYYVMNSKKWIVHTIYCILLYLKGIHTPKKKYYFIIDKDTLRYEKKYSKNRI